MSLKARHDSDDTPTLVCSYIADLLHSLGQLHRESTKFHLGCRGSCTKRSGLWHAMVGKAKVIVSVWSKYEFGCSCDNFTSILLLVTDGHIAPTAAVAAATFPSTAAAYHSDTIRHIRRVVEEGQLEYIGEAVSTGAAKCSGESSMSVSRY